VYRSLEELPNQLFGFESIELTKAVSAFAYVDMYARCDVPEFSLLLHNLACIEPKGGIPFMDAVLRSYWRRPCNERHIESCFTTMGTESSTENDKMLVDIAIETLLRFDKAGEVPPARLEYWWNRKIVNAAPAARWRTLSWLSARHSGRAELLTRLNDSASSEIEGLRIDIRDILAQRLDATAKLNRWDFISKEEAVTIGNAIKVEHQTN
jgi:hypothetical protein